MHLLETKIVHDTTGWRVDFVGDDGEAVSIKVADGHAASEDEAIERAKEVMVQLTAYGTRRPEHQPVRCRQQWKL